MIKFQPLLLASSALLASTALAQAADLPFRKAAPVEYVRVCDAFGSGFFYIPGTDSCLRVSGQIRAELTIRGGAPTSNPAAFAYNQAGQVFRRDLTNFRARGYLNADVRTQTAYGTLRTFVSYRLTNDTTAPGPTGGRGDVVAGVPARESTGNFQGYNPTATQSTLDKGFIQFAGFTAGRAQSFFDFDAQSYELLSNSIANSNQVTEMLAYTYTFGGGFSGTISVEDRNERVISDNGLFVLNGPNALAGAAFTNVEDNPTVTAAGVRTAGVLAYAGEAIPDIVANLRYDADWGSAQLSGAYHSLRSIPVSAYSNTGALLASTRTGQTVYTPSSDGFAVLGGVKVNLPMLAKGDSVTFQGTYQEGAMDYVDPVNYQPNGISNVFAQTRNANGTGGLESTFGIPLNDAYTVTNGFNEVSIAKSRAAGAYGAFRHYFIPEVYGTLFGAYLNITDPSQAQRLGAGNDSAVVVQGGANVVWTPIKDLQIGGEILYTNLSYRGLAATTANNTNAAAINLTPQNPDDIRGRFTIRRAF